MRSSISLANQEDAARATEDDRARDVAYQRDFAAIVEAMRIAYHSLLASRTPVWSPGAAMAVRLGKLASGSIPYSSEEAYLAFSDMWGFPALLRALARAIELETGK